MLERSAVTAGSSRQMRGCIVDGKLCLARCEPALRAGDQSLGDIAPSSVRRGLRDLGHKPGTGVDDRPNAMIARFFKIKHLLFSLALVLVCQPAQAGKRVAFVLANSAYQNAPGLANPVNDGALIATTLKDAGFDVVESRRDLSALETRRALRDFSDQARDADIAVVYYAGHGLEVDGSNYLVPVDAKLERDSDVYDEAFSLDRILLAVEPAKRLRLVILDACRDNPFDKTMKRTMASR